MKKVTELRNADLLTTARQVLALSMRRHQTLNVNQLIDAVLHRQPRMHYFEYDYASKILHAIKAHGVEAVIYNKMAQEQWLEIKNQVEEAMAARQSLTFDQALSFVLHFRRPSRFYLTRNTAFRILNRHFRTAVVEVRV